MPLPKPLLIRALQNYFKKLNPIVPLDAVDWEAYADPTLTFHENVEVFKKAYPMFHWESPREEEGIESELSEVEINYDYLTYLCNSFEDENIRRDCVQSLDELVKQVSAEGQDITQVLNELKRLREENENLQRQIQQLSEKGTKITKEEAQNIFCSILEIDGIDCKDYMKELEEEWPAIEREKDNARAIRHISEVALEIVREERRKKEQEKGPPQQAQAAQQLQGISAGYVSRGRIYIAPSSVPMEAIRQALREGGARMNLGSSEIQAIADRLKSYGVNMMDCMDTNGKPLEETGRMRCTQALRFAGKVLQDVADMVARYGLLGFVENSWQRAGKLHVDALMEMKALRSILPPSTAEIMGKPVYYWLAVVFAYNTAKYFGLEDIAQMLYGGYDEFFRHFGL